MPFVRFVVLGPVHGEVDGQWLDLEHRLELELGLGDHHAVVQAPPFPMAGSRACRSRRPATAGSTTTRSPGDGGRR